MSEEIIVNTNPEVRAAFTTTTHRLPTLGSDLGNGTNTVSLTGLTVGQTYVVRGVGGTLTGVTLDGAGLVMHPSRNVTSFVATATSHTVALTAGTATSITVQQITATAPSPPQFEGVSLRAAIPEDGPNSNFAVGSPEVHQFLIDGTSNTAVGRLAQQFLTTGANNTGVGAGAQRRITTGRSNTSVGASSQVNLTTGFNNTAQGASAQQNLTTGFSNTAQGESAQQNLTTGVGNTAQGVAAQRNLTTGDNNTAQGFAAGSAFVTGSNNLSLGRRAGGFTTAQSDVSGSVQIGTDNTGVGAFTTGDNQIALGTTLHTFKCGAVNGETGFWALGVAKAGTPSAPASPTYLTVKVDGTVYDIPVGPGGGSGIPASTIDAKGDLLVGTANDTVARLPVGATNGHVLTVDSAEAAGVKWAAPSGGTATRWALRLPGTSGNFVSTPSPINYTSLTELDLRWVGTISDLSAGPLVISQIDYQGTAGATRYPGLQANATLVRGFLLASGSNANTLFEWTHGGAVIADTIIGLRLVWRADNGSAVPDVRIFTSADEGATWTVRSTQTASVPTALAATTNVLAVGATAPGVNNMLNGLTLHASIRRNGTLVAEYDARDGIVQRYTDAQGNLWTVNGSAWSGRKGI